MPNFKTPFHGRDHGPLGGDPSEDLRWFYVLPVAPAVEPLDYITGDTAYVNFAGAWANIGSDWLPTAYGLAFGGAPVVRVIATGDEDTPGSTIFTIPSVTYIDAHGNTRERFRPAKTTPTFARMGADGTLVGMVDVNADGTVVFVDLIRTAGGGGPWLYVEPVAPSIGESDYVFGNPLYPTFASPWGNINADRPGTAFRFMESGQHLQLRLAITGGEDTPGSLIFTLPTDYRPARITRLFAEVGADGEGIGTVDVYPDGTVVYVGLATVGSTSPGAIDGGSP